VFSSLRGRRRLRWIALLVVVAGALAAYVVTREPGDVSHPEVEFTAEQPPAAPSGREPKPGEHPMDDGFRWPVFHLTPSRTGYLPTRSPLRPPFVEQWRLSGNILLEFPPVLCGRSLFLLKNNGALYRVSRLTGEVRWKRKLGYLAAASPACDGRTVYAVLLQRGKGIRAGRVVALNAATGRTRWSRKIRSRVESSPVLASGRLYFGSEDGTLYAIRARDGALRWRYRANGAIKGGPALARGILYFGDYGGRLHAVRRRDGRRVWRTLTSRGSFGVRTGRIYGTPAVAYGRVYVGSLDGSVYSFAASTGKLAWRHGTGGYVYSSPAVATIPGVGPTVYVGSFSKRLYALDARSGRVRWARKTGGRISGGPTVVGDLVLYSNLGRRSTGAVGAATGRLMWSLGSGAFNPAISDGRRLYVVGYGGLFMFSDRRTARSDGRVRARYRRTPTARRERADRRRARAERADRRRVARRVAARRRAVAANVRARRAGREVCFRRGGRKVCRIPRPLVCVKRGADGRTVCRPRKPVVCFERDGRRTCRARRQ